MGGSGEAPIDLVLAENTNSLRCSQTTSGQNDSRQQLGAHEINITSLNKQA